MTQTPELAPARAADLSMPGRDIASARIMRTVKRQRDIAAFRALVGLTEGADPDSIVITRETLAALTATYAEAQERARELEADREGDRAHHAAVCEELITTVASATVQKVLGSGLLREIAKTAVEAAAKAEPARHAAAQRHAATDHEAEAQRLADEAARARPCPSPPAEPSINHLTPWQQVAAGTKPAAPYVRRRPGAFE